MLLRDLDNVPFLVDPKKEHLERRKIVKKYDVEY